MTLRGRGWIPIGPSPLDGDLQFNGLVSAIAIQPSNPDIIYVGTGGGGLWKSINGGERWIPLFDRQQSLGVGEPSALVIDPSNPNTLYVGASTRINRGTPNNVVQGPTGLFKSTDGGYSWIRLGSGYPLGNSGNADDFDEQNINVVIGDPASPNTLYLASNSGVFRSIDGGLNWTRGMTPTGNIFGDARSLILDTSSATASRTLYVGISANGIFRSIDGGLNWTRILDRTTPVIQQAIGSGSFGKVVVDIAPAISPPNPAGVQIIYATLQGTGGAPDPLGIFISRDQGLTWSQQAGNNMPTTIREYAHHMAVDPLSPGDGINDTIYFGGVGQRRSDDSGNNFTTISPGLHADTHAWTFSRHPTEPGSSIVYCGTDGGLFKSDNRGATWVPLNSGGVQTALFYNISLKPNTPGKGIQVGALQDNDVRTTATAIGDEWKGTQSGDVWDVAFDGSIDRQVYASRGFYSVEPNTRILRSTDDGLTFPTFITPPSWRDGITDRGNYHAMIATDPNPQAGGTVYVSGNQNLWQSFDGGDNWRIITPISGSCDCIDVARGNSSYVVIAIDAKIYVSTNALEQASPVIFTDITRNLPNRFVTRVAFDPVDPSTIYAVLAGFNSSGNIGHVFRTNLGASGWTDISPNLNVPCSALALEGSAHGNFPTRIYVGTEFGVLRSVDGGSSWYILDDIHFPRVPVLDLEIRSGLLIAATYGRGAFAFFNNIGMPVIAMNLEHNLAFGTVQQGPKYLTLRIFNVGDPRMGSIIMTDLVIESVQRLMGSTSFSVLSTPGTPVHIRAGDFLDFTIEYFPTGGGVEETATIRIISNDPFAPFVDLSATGMQAAYD
jgi:photosystem II stability/assembly factor-like uncharacterized protein